MKRANFSLQVSKMTRIGKFVAVLASIAVFAMPAAAVSLPCMIAALSGEANAHHCHMMMAVNSSADQISASPHHSCCQVSAAKPESMSVLQSPAGKGIVAPPATNALLSDRSAEPVLHRPFAPTVLSRSSPPQAVLCTFLI